MFVAAVLRFQRLEDGSISEFPEAANTENSSISAISKAGNTVNSSISEFAEAANQCWHLGIRSFKNAYTLKHVYSGIVLWKFLYNIV